MSFELNLPFFCVGLYNMNFNNYKYKTFGYTKANRGGSTFNGKWEDWDSEITNRQRQKELYGLNLSSHSIAKIKLNKANI